MSLKENTASGKVVCSINPNILKQLGLDRQIKNALAKASKPKKLPQKAPVKNVTQAKVEKRPDRETVPEKRKIQVIKQEKVDINIATELLQTLPRHDTIKYTKIIEARLRNAVKTEDCAVEVREDAEASQEPVQEYLMYVEEQQQQQPDQQSEVLVEEEIEYIVEGSECCPDFEEFPEQVDEHDDLIIFEDDVNLLPPDNTEDCGVKVVLVETEDVTVVEPVENPEITANPSLEEQDPRFKDKSPETERTSESEESFLGFSNSSHDSTSDISQYEVWSGASEVPDEDIGDDDTKLMTIKSDGEENSEKSHILRFRSFSDTISTVRSRSGLHTELRKAVAHLRNSRNLRPAESSGDEEEECSESDSVSSGGHLASDESSSDDTVEEINAPNTVTKNQLIRDIIRQKEILLKEKMERSYQELQRLYGIASDLEVPTILPAQSHQRLTDRISGSPEVFHPDPRILQHLKIEVSNHGLRTVSIPNESGTPASFSPIPGSSGTSENVPHVAPSRENTMEPDEREVPQSSDPEESSTAAFIITEIEEPSVFVKSERMDRTSTKSSSMTSTSESPQFIGFTEESSEDDYVPPPVISPPEERPRRIKAEKSAEDEKTEPRRGLRLRPLSQIMKASDIYDIPQGVFRSSSRLLKSQEPQCHEAEEMMMPPPKKVRGGKSPKETKKTKTSRQQVQGDVTCGKCEATFSSTTWEQHLVQHNGVAWRVGIDQSMDLENEISRGNTIQAFMKKRKLTSVKCEKCGLVRKSGVGLVSHERVCGLTKGEDSLITCEHCSRRILPCSLRVHQTNHCKGLRKLLAVHAASQAVLPPDGASTSSAEVTNGGRQKRKSTRVAETKFRLSLEPGDNEPFPRSESDASFGIESSDSDGSSGVTETSGLLSSDPDEIFKRKKKKKAKKKNSSASKKKNTSSDASRGSNLSMWRQMNKESLEIYFSSNIKEFFIKNYSLDPLFPQWCPSRMSVTENDYLPKSTTSIFYDQYTVNHYKVSFGGAFSKSISTLQCFESKKGNPLVIYCGGPVLSFDWLQNPPEQVSGEILAISCGADFQMKYTYKENLPEKTAIQIWSIGSRGDGGRSATFIYGIAYDFAPVMCLKFCPSGGFSEAGRLGLLALSSCVGKIEILSLPMPPVDGKIIKLAPSVILESRQEGLITRIAWSPARGHGLVAGGFANGDICVWRLDIISKIIRQKRDRTEIFYPIHLLHAFTNPVTVLTFPHTESYNVLLSASLDKHIKMFNLDGGGIEISDYSAKSQVTSAVCPLNWPMYIYGTDNSYQWNRTEVTLKQPFNVPFDELTNLVHSQEITDVDFNNWNNVIIAATESGDICTSYRQHYGTLSKKADMTRNCLGYTDSIVLLGKSNVSLNVEILSSNIDNCAVLFCDFTKGADIKGIQAFRTRNMNHTISMQLATKRDS
ncbi:hypothetical protein DMENIID0001_048160 [Sergentomyia squamirostris]